MAVHEYISQEAQDLQRELSNGMHPNLVQLLAFTPVDERLEEIAAWCGIPIDAYVDEEGMKKLCKILTDNLILKRESPNGIIIVQ